MANIKEAIKRFIPDSPKKALIELTALAGIYGFLASPLVAENKPKKVICKDGICMISTETAKAQKLEQRIVYTSVIGGRSYDYNEICTCDLNGKNENRLTFNKVEDNFPVFSPDGKKIAFCSYKEGNADIFIMNNDGTNQENLTKSLADELCPSYSPDGKKIIFHSPQGGIISVYEMDINGKNKKLISSNNGFNVSYSPDNKKIIFDSVKNGYNRSLKILDLKTNNEKVLFEDTNPFGHFPKWSPDGKKILFNKGWFDKDGNSKLQICLYDLKTNHIDELTDGSFEDGKAAFSPDGNAILFYSNRDGIEYEIYRMDANGRNIKKLTSGGKFKMRPVMSPLTVFNDSANESALKQESKETEIQEMQFPEIKNDNIESVLKSTGTVVVDAYTVWCGPCKHYSKDILGPASQKYKNVRFMKVDAEKNREISKKYNIEAYPTTLIFKDGKFVEKFVGADGGKLENMIKKYSK